MGRISQEVLDEFTSFYALEFTTLLNDAVFEGRDAIDRSTAMFAVTRGFAQALSALPRALFPGDQVAPRSVGSALLQTFCEEFLGCIAEESSSPPAGCAE